MNFKIRQHVIDQFGCRSVKVQTFNGEPGSGVLDVTGREIFAGDRVRPVKKPEIVVNVTYHDAAFWLDWLDPLPLFDIKNGELEIIGYGGASHAD